MQKLKNVTAAAKFFALLFIWGFVLLIALSSPAKAQIAGPGWISVKAEPIAPEDGRLYSADNTTKAPLAAGTESVALSNPLPSRPTMATAITPEIAALASALQHDPKLIYDYVHNHIDYVPYCRSLKGATLTYLDGCGNDFDQASLMIALLRASGHTAVYVYGVMEIPGDQLANWLGVDQIPENIRDILSGGGIPNLVYADGTALCERVWVRANIGGSTFLFDPAFKSYDYKNKIDIADALGYNRIELLNAAGGSFTSNYIQSVNEASLKNKMVDYSSNLVNSIRNQYPNSRVSEIVGGRSIVETQMVEYPSALPFYSEVWHVWSEIPNEGTARIRIQHFGIDYTLYVPEIGGKRITIDYAGPNSTPRLLLEGNLVAIGNTTTAGVIYDCILTIDHPYDAWEGTYCDQTSTYRLKSGSTYAIVSAFAGTSDALLQKRQKKLDAFIADQLGDTSEPVLGETLNIMGLTWLKELLYTEKLAHAIAETVNIHHHSIGVMAQETGYYIDVKADINFSISRHGNEAAQSNSIAIIGSAFEHGVLEQLMGSDNPGISTIKLFQVANSRGDKVFWINSGNFQSIAGQLSNYDLSEIQAKVNDGWTLIMPANGQIGIGDWSGKGYIEKKTDIGTYIGLVIDGDYYGGYSSFLSPVEPSFVNSSTQINTFNYLNPDTAFFLVSAAPNPPQSLDPVDMASGAFLHDNTDLALGGAAPLGLSLTRSYNSSRNLEKGTFGYGWTHNYDIHISKTSNGEPGLGKRQPVDAAAMIAAIYVSQDLMVNQNDIRGWMVASLISKWAVDQLINNAFTVHIGNRVMEYIKLADGTFAPPPGITTTLVRNTDDTFSLEERFGTRLDFNSSNRISQWRDIDGNTLTFSYSGNNIQTIRDAFNRSLTFHHNGDLIDSVSDSTGRSVSYGYAADGNLVRYTDPEGKIWRYEYDSEHRMTALVNPLNITTAVNTYDELGRVDTQTVPRQGGGTATYNFYFSGFRNIEEDPFGNQMVYYFDEKGLTVASQNALGHAQKMEYDGQNHLVRSIDPRGYQTVSEYDGDNNLIKTTNAFNHENINIYDAQFRLVDTYDPLEHRTHFVYDAEHHLIRTEIYPEPGMQISTGTSPYPNGLPHTVTDGRGIITTMTYDGYGNPDTSRVADEPVINYDYDAVGRLVTLTDQAGAVTTFTYDDRGLLLTRTDPLEKTTTYNYYGDGRLHTRTDRNNDTITYTYTPSGKPDTITYPNAATVSFFYDIRDNLDHLEDPVGTTSYTYDEVNRLISKTDPYGLMVSYEYDEAGNLKQLTYPGDKKVIYTYDELNRLETVTIDWLSQVPAAVYHYDEAGRMTELNHFNGTWTGYGYDNANRLTDVQNRKTDLNAISRYHFTLDGNGNRKFIDQQEPLAPSLSPASIFYTYNIQKNRLLEAGTTQFGYNDEGQLTSKRGTTYSFDYDHRLASIAEGNYLYSYDYMGNRLRAIRNGVTNRYIYDEGGNLLAEADQNNVITRYYIYGTGLLAMVTPADDIYCYHFNAVGSTIAMTDGSQNVVNIYAYTSFGTILSQQETIAQPFKYVGQHGVMAEPNGLYYMRARYYDPEVGRFISEDPLGFEGGDVNLSVYVRNNPVSYIDPEGLNPAFLAVDFVNGFLAPGPPPPTWGGAAGYFAREICDSSGLTAAVEKAVPYMWESYWKENINRNWKNDPYDPYYPYKNEPKEYYFKRH